MPAGLPYVGWVTRPDKNGQPPPCFGQCTLNIGARKVGAAMKRLPQLQYGDKAKEQILQKWDPVSKRLVTIGDLLGPSYFTSNPIFTLNSNVFTETVGIHASNRRRGIYVDFLNNGITNSTTGGTVLTSAPIVSPYLESGVSTSITYNGNVYGGEYYYARTVIPADAESPGEERVSNTGILNLNLSSRSLALTPSQATVGYTSNYLSRRTNTVITDGLGGVYATDSRSDEIAGTYSKQYSGTVYGGERYTSTLSLYNGTQFVDFADFPFSFSGNALTLTSGITGTAQGSYTISNPCRSVMTSITNPTDGTLITTPAASRTSGQTLTYSGKVYGGEPYTYTVLWYVNGILQSPYTSSLTLPLTLSGTSFTVSPVAGTFVDYTNSQLSRQTTIQITNANESPYTQTVSDDTAGSHQINYVRAAYGNETYTATVTQLNGQTYGPTNVSYTVNADTDVPTLTLDAGTGILNSTPWVINRSGAQIRSGQYQFVNNSNTNSTTGGTVVSTQLYPSSGAPYTRGDVSPYSPDPFRLWNYYYGQLRLPDATVVKSPTATRYIPFTAITSVSANSVSDVVTFAWDITPNPWIIGVLGIEFTFLDSSNNVVSATPYTTIVLSGSISVSRFDITNQTYRVQLSMVDTSIVLTPMTLSEPVTPATSFSFITAPTMSQVSGTSATVGWTDPCNAQVDIRESLNSALVASVIFSAGSITTLAANTFPTTQTITVPTINPSRYYFSRIRARNFSDTTNVATSAYSNAVAGRFTRAYTNVLNGGGATSNFSSFELSSSSANPYVYTLQSLDSVTALSRYFVNDGNWTSTNAQRYMVIGDVSAGDLRYCYFVDGVNVKYKLFDIVSGTFSGSLTTPTLSFSGAPTSLSGIAYDLVNNAVYVASPDKGFIYRIINIRTTPVITTFASGFVANTIRAIAYDGSNDTIYVAINIAGSVGRYTGVRAGSNVANTSFTATMSVIGVVGIALSSDNNTLYAFGTSGIFSNTSPRTTNAQTALSSLSSSVTGGTAGLISIDSDNNMHICNTTNNRLIRAYPSGTTGSVIDTINTNTTLNGTFAGVATFSGIASYGTIVSTTATRYSKDLTV